MRARPPAEDLVVLAPHGERRRLVRAEVLLERGIEIEVEPVVPEQRQLDLLVAAALEAGLVERPRIGREPVAPTVRHTVFVYPASSGRLEAVADRLGVGHAVGRIREQAVPEPCQALHVRVAVLRDQRADPLGILARDAETDGCAVVLHVERKAIVPELVE